MTVPGRRTTVSLAFAATCAFLSAALFPTVARALPPPRPGLVDPLTQRYRTTGQKVPVFPKEVRTYRQSVRKGGVPLDPKRAPARAGARPLAVDTRTQSVIRPLVLLIDFDDRQAGATPSIANPAAFDALYFGSGPADLSVRNYWNEVSYGRFAIQRPSAVSANPDVVGWLRAGGTAPGGFPTAVVSAVDIAGVNVPNVAQLLADAIASLSSQGFDFSPYVRPSDNTFNAVIIVQPGYGAEDSGNPAADTYSHTAPIAPIATAAGTITEYTIVPSVQYYNDPTPDTNPADDQRIGAGVIVHEMGHLLGLPDLYPTQPFGQTTDVFTGAGVFDLMAYGLWGSNLLLRADNPAHLSAWSKYFLGWVTPALVASTSARSLRPVEIFGDVDKVWSNTANDPTQYFLVENREVSSSLGSWLFDKFLPGAGALVWQVDEYVVNAYSPGNAVNNNPQFRGVYVKEADGVYHLAQTIPSTGTPNDLAKYFGQQEDYFAAPSQLFDRATPSAEVNSSPVIDNAYTVHPVDFGQNVKMSGFTRTATNAIDYTVLLSGGDWKVYNTRSTAPPAFPAPMPSDDIISLAFDSANALWMGSFDRGIFRFLGASFVFLDSASGLPEASPPATIPLSPIRSMAFESETGSMWVGTDRGLYKMRDAGSGYRVQSSFTSTTPPPAALPVPLERVKGVSVQKGTDAKYLATDGGLVLVTDGLTDGSADDRAALLGSAFAATAVAIDENEVDFRVINPRNDVLWVSASQGVIFRSDGQLPVGPVDRFPLPLKSYTLAGNPRITSLAVDKQGILWIGTDRGVQAFDLRDNANPPQPNLRDPYDFNGDGDLVTETYLNFNATGDEGGANGSNNVTGIGFQTSTLTLPVAWISQRSDTLFPGGTSRFDANVQNDNTTAGRDERLKAYSPVPPPDVPSPSGRSSSVSAAAGDAAGNVWFATSQPPSSTYPTDRANGAVRFGSAGFITLDSNNYVNTTAIARVTLVHGVQNSSDTVVDRALVEVTTNEDGTGFVMAVTETGPASGVFVGTFGFTTGATDPAAQLVKVNGKGDVVTVASVVPGVLPAKATWRAVFPFEDGLLIKPLCFVATAAYGSAMAPEVEGFRKFRDRVLLAVPGGKALVALYYRAGPPLAEWVSQGPERRFLARRVLVPPLMVAGWATGTTAAEKAATIAAVLSVFLACSRRRRTGRAVAGTARSRKSRE